MLLCASKARRPPKPLVHNKRIHSNFDRLIIYLTISLSELEFSHAGDATFVAEHFTLEGTETARTAGVLCLI